jgi:3-oxoacyl-[acyl-carrier-protein] synthase-3
MAWIRGFGHYVPCRVVNNVELSPLLDVDPSWLLSVSGIEQRRFAAEDESVASLGARAARSCLRHAGISKDEVGMVIVASGSSERRFPGPATAIAAAIGISGVPAIDLPLASAGSLFGMSLAARLCEDYRNVLVVGSEVMSRTVQFDAANRGTAVLFGDGAGACVISSEKGFAAIGDSLLASDGNFAEALRLDLHGSINMDGRTIILQASRKLPRCISELLERNRYCPGDIGCYLMHQANLNLIVRVANALKVPEERFYHNIARYGNTSSASVLIAASEWFEEAGRRVDTPVVFAAFGAGLNWGALLALPA